MVRFARLPLAAALVFGTFGLSAPVAAQETAPPRSAALADAAATQVRAPTALHPESPTRPSALVPLYVSFSVLQLIDVHSTSRALDRGAVEANPMLRGFASNEVGLIAVKAAGTAGVVYASERIWKQNRMAAVLFMVATNSALAWAVQHNYRAVR